MLSSVSVSIHVLLIDDDADSREIYRHFLEWGGFDVETASTGSAGVRAANKRPPDVVFVDLDMPGMTGIEVLRQLRANPGTAPIPVVALTGVPELLDRVEDVRFDLVLAKPALDDQVTTAARRLTLRESI